MPNLYLFRNVLTSKVLLSTNYILKPHLYKQIGEHWPSHSIRPDHWVPFVVLTGIPSLDLAKHLQELVLSRKPAPPLPIASYRYPIYKVPSRMLLESEGKTATEGEEQPILSIRPYAVPDDIRDRVSHLCEVLNEHGEGLKKANDKALARMTGATKNARVETNQSTTVAGAYPPSLYWERDEFRTVVAERQLFWPDWMSHYKLLLKRGRFPIDLPGYDSRRLVDKYEEDPTDLMGFKSRRFKREVRRQDSKTLAAPSEEMIRASRVTKMSKRMNKDWIYRV
ncbi:hypothetical protein M427DRAFT_121932 [Gonapodya prolifera JEL478]|uniref:Uncharacterized protein n=1 Tax=Gonapodya prolifera (strain JEL478) TaxID=1344416 RepID=A0A139ALU6_GONPJ|nr:hypothetical protein M427DRAFT_121932 [Gonapodya prolifera JEL478]|eukprot:KXS17534.1 hypothetical protein M427DRAFT_121932 [Gonapodya prolifera JEL478]